MVITCYYYYYYFLFRRSMDNDMILLLVVVVLPYRFKISISEVKVTKNMLNSIYSMLHPYMVQVP